MKEDTERPAEERGGGKRAAGLLAEEPDAERGLGRNRGWKVRCRGMKK